MREQLYAEERQRLLIQNKSTRSLTSGSTLLQININVLPSQSSQPAGFSSWAPEGALNSIEDDLIDISGLLEAAVEEYATWHLSRVGTESQREHIRTALVSYYFLAICNAKQAPPRIRADISEYHR